MPAGHFPLGSVVFGFPTLAGCLSALIGLTFPLSVLAVPRFLYVRWSRASEISASKGLGKHRRAACRVQTKRLEGRKKKKKNLPETAEEQLCMTDYPIEPVDL